MSGGSVEDELDRADCVAAPKDTREDYWTGNMLNATGEQVSSVSMPLGEVLVSGHLTTDIRLYIKLKKILNMPNMLIMPNIFRQLNV